MAEQGFAPPTSEWHHPSAEIVAAANVPDYDAVYQAALDDPQAFWAQRAEALEWYQKWDAVLDDSNKPFYKWFTGGKTNLVLNALDRHMTTHRRNKSRSSGKANPATAPLTLTASCGARSTSSPMYCATKA